jgi:osmotically-inducible protein OsmY
MKRMSFWFSSLALFALLTFNVTAQDMQKNPDAKPKAAKAKAVMPTADPEILKCIQEKFANAASLKDKPPSVAVTNGVATITGEAKNGGAKGGATRIAKSCGAKEIKNEMTVAASAKKPAEKKS